MFLAIAALIGFLFGVLVGYLWRDRISRARRAKYRVEQEKRRAIEMELGFNSCSGRKQNVSGDLSPRLWLFTASAF
jgi:hypothetical protein